VSTSLDIVSTIHSTIMPSMDNDLLFKKQQYTSKVCIENVAKAAYINSNSSLLVGKQKTSDRSHKCDVCGKGFSRKDYLNKHILCHTGHRPYKCDVCGKGFNRKDILNKHMFTHTGHWPHKCDVCGKGFSQKSHLTNHCFIHTNDRPHTCDVCGIDFCQKSDLNKHLNTHTDDYKKL